jgi:hypothetical protein
MRASVIVLGQSVPGCALPSMMRALRMPPMPVGIPAPRRPKAAYANKVMLVKSENPPALWGRRCPGEDHIREELFT